MTVAHNACPLARSTSKQPELVLGHYFRLVATGGATACCGARRLIMANRAGGR